MRFNFICILLLSSLAFLIYFLWPQFHSTFDASATYCKLLELARYYGEDKWGAQFTLILLWFYSLVVALIRISIASIFISMISDVIDSCCSEYNLRLVFTFGSRNVWGGHLRLFISTSVEHLWVLVVLAKILVQTLLRDSFQEADEANMLEWLDIFDRIRKFYGLIANHMLLWSV